MRGGGSGSRSWQEATAAVRRSAASTQERPVCCGEGVVMSLCSVCGGSDGARGPVERLRGVNQESTPGRRVSLLVGRRPR